MRNSVSPKSAATKAPIAISAVSDSAAIVAMSSTRRSWSRSMAMSLRRERLQPSRQKRTLRDAVGELQCPAVRGRGLLMPLEPP